MRFNLPRQARDRREDTSPPHFKRICFGGVFPHFIWQEHLGVSIESKEFWARSTAIVERKLDGFEASLTELGM